MLRDQSRPPCEYIEKPGIGYLVTGILSDAAIERSFTGKPFLVGTIRNDQETRFEDGARIFTSFLVEEVVPDVWLTQSQHVYRVESWRNKNSGTQDTAA